MLIYLLLEDSTNLGLDLVCCYKTFLQAIKINKFEIRTPDFCSNQFVESLRDKFHMMNYNICVTVCLCWRCTRAGMTSDPDVVLLRWAFWVQGDLILFITGAGSTRQCLWVVVLAPLVL